VIRVLVVDDHRLVRAGLVGLLSAAAGIEVIAQASDGATAIEIAIREQPDVILMDVSMPAMDGVTATKRIVAEYPDARIVALTSFAEHSRVSAMLSSGAVGYLLKDCEPENLLAAVRAAALGQVPLDPRVAAAVLPGRTRSAPALSNREVDVLRLTAKGLANKQIGRALGISERTVKVHLGNVFRHLGVADRTSAAMWARDHLPAPDEDQPAART
jgi:DNA-binding NarL/FixJ family response regulator